MISNKVSARFLLIIVPFIAFFYFFNDIENSFSLYSMEHIVGIVAILSGIAGIIMGISSSRQASLDAVKDYFQQGDQSELVSARKKLFEHHVNGKDFKDDDIAKVCNFFHFWGLMNRKRYLPIWVFEGSSGVQAVKLYKILEPIIVEKRKNNKFYAVEFERLVKRIKTKYKADIED